MTLEIELRAVRSDHGAVVWCDLSQAASVALYAGEPGAFRWIMDFEADEVEFAIDAATALAEVFDVPFHNRIGEC